MVRGFLCVVVMVLVPAEVVSRVAEAGETGTEPITVSEKDWPWWRGPNHNGVAAADQNPPLVWNDAKNMHFKVSLPGRGHGSPTVVADNIYLATADEKMQIQSVLCFDRRNAKRKWKTELHRGGFVFKNKKASLASSTVACDGKRLYINFFNHGAVFTTALDLDGKQLWRTKISGYVPHQGFASSPSIYKSLVLVSADNKGGGALAALDRATGKIVWRNERPKTPNYPSPIVHKIGGRDQLLMTGCQLVSSYNPLTGKKNWEIAGSTTECVTSIVTDGQLVFTSGGYPRNHVSAVRADGSGKVVWENNVRVYVPSMLVQDGYIYAVTDAGVATCWKSDTGKQRWQGRLGGVFSSSPVLVGEKIFATNESGKTFIFKASPKRFDLLGMNQLGDEVFATPAICGSRIYMRIAEYKDERRQESLCCIAREDKP